MAKYITYGSILYDRVTRTDGSPEDVHIGGHSLYALAGVRLFDKSCKMVEEVGEDFKDGFVPWLETNGIPTDGIRYVEEETPSTRMTFRDDGSYEAISMRAGPPFTYELGYLATKPWQIEMTLDQDTKAIYHHTFKPDRKIFRDMDEIRQKHGIQFMWEIMFPVYGSGDAALDLEKFKYCAKIADMISLNKFEASVIYGIPEDNDEDMVDAIIRTGPEFCLYRVGKKGAYAITGNNAIFCGSIDPFGPSVDPTGCGNNSTGAAMWAWCETKDPAFTLACANVSAGYNAGQYGPWPVFRDEDMAHALALSKEIAERLREQ